MTSTGKKSLNFLTSVLLWALIGGLATVFGTFSYRVYILKQSGFRLGAVPLDTLLMDVMELHLYGAFGAGAGMLFGILLAIGALIRRYRRNRTATDQTPDLPDPDTIIRSLNRERAERYLAKRRRRERRT